MAGQNQFQVLLSNYVNMIGEHYVTRMKMSILCSIEKTLFLIWIDLNPALEATETHLKENTNGTFKTLQMKELGLKKFQIPSRESKVPNWQFLIWNF